MGRLSGEPQGVGSGVPRNEEKESLVEEIWTQLPSTPQSNTWPGASVYMSVKWGDRSKWHGKTGLLQTKRRPGVAAAKRGDPRPAPPHPHLLPAAFGGGHVLARDNSRSRARAGSPTGKTSLTPPVRGPGVLQHPDLLGPLLSSVVQPQQPLGLNLLHPPRALCLQPTLRTQLTWGAPGGDPSSGRLPPHQAGGEGVAGRGHMTGTPAPRRLLPLPHPPRFPPRGGCRCRSPRPAPFRPGRPPWSLISRSQAARPCRESATLT